MHYYVLACEEGDERAINTMANLYACGQIVEKNTTTAVLLYNKLTNLTYESKANLGILYLSGDGVSADEKKGLSLIQEAASNGISNAEYLIGSFYATGYLVETDFEQALYWLNRAAEKNDKNAIFNLGVLYDSGDGVERNIIKRNNLWKVSASLGHNQSIDILRNLNIEF